MSNFMMNPKLIASENQEQRALVHWIRTQPRLIDHIMKFNNEGKRTAGQTWNLKQMGMMVGASDLFLAIPTASFSGLFLEIKQNRPYTRSERLRPTWKAQQAFIERMKAVGYDGHFVFGWEHGKRIIENYLK